MFLLPALDSRRHRRCRCGRWPACGDEQQVAQPVQVADRDLRDPLAGRGRQGDDAPLRAAADGAGHVQRGGGQIAGGQDEHVQRRQGLLEEVDVVFQGRDVLLRNQGDRQQRGSLAASCEPRLKSSFCTRWITASTSCGSPAARANPSIAFNSSTVP